MTTPAAGFGASPLALGSGTGAELRRPLGIAIVGGPTVSQVLTLFTTPSRTSRGIASYGSVASAHARRTGVANTRAALAAPRPGARLGWEPAGTANEQRRVTMFMKLGLLSVFSLTTALAITQPGCDAVERIYNCSAICEKYEDCVDAEYDVSACKDRCTDAAADSEAYEDKADACQACVDDRSCTGAIFNCGTECAGIVP